ncbi:winged helix-turn-helix domain-containing protein [Natrinema sp. DC36]|uniref:helix-turn-helix transcriptional regulator n=1 Tax=Natrinema sp. DC36 TaxID=2878680 RepID=UPI001CF0510D|nr:winged helix-turn-helix domain-containing protein [Natrinema sp. DC36]
MTETATLVEDLPPSAKLVYKVLEYEGDLTQSEIADETLLSPSTVRDAVAHLEDAGVIEGQQGRLPDARKKVYYLVK